MREYPKLPPRLRWIFSPNPAFFVTFFTYQRRKLLAADSVNSAFVAFARHAYTRNVAVGRYVIMPDHLHLFVCGPDDFELGRWVGALKRHLAKVAGSTNPSRPIWQRGFFDHVLRSNESHGQKWIYVRENPVRAGLVEKAEDWPYQGEIVYIDRA